MKKLNSLFEKFYKADKDARVKFCLKILRRLVKNHSLLIWFLTERREKIFNDHKDFTDYYSRFRSEKGSDFIITLNLAGDESGDYIRYEFAICRVGDDYHHNVELGHIIHRIEIGKLAKTVVMGRGDKLPLKYGYFVVGLYSKIANQLQAVKAQNELRNALRETLEALKMQTA